MRGNLDFGDVAGLRALRTVNDLELHCLALFERAEAVALNGREVHEDVAASVALDEPVPLRVVEPLDLACNTHRSLPAAVTRSVASLRDRVGGQNKGPKKKGRVSAAFPLRRQARPASKR